MKKMKKAFVAISLMIVAMGMSVSCTSEFDTITEPQQENPTDEQEPQRAVMNFDGGIVPFDATTRTTTDEWADGAKVYLHFTVGGSTVGGIATYSATTSQWTVEYYGNLTEGEEAKCEAYYFENAKKANHINVLLTEHSIIYEDKAAVYMFEDNTLTVVASLKPKTGRLKLKGKVGEKYRFSGVTYYNAYDISQNNFTTIEPTYLYSDEGLGKDGCTDYFYVFFSDEEKRELCFDDMESGFSYVRTFDDRALAVGRSGYLNIPSLNNRSGWSNLTKDITVSGVTFRMIRVLYANGADSPYFYIGETEVTQKLWETVMGEDNNPSTFSGDNLPVNNVSKDYCDSFIAALNEKTKMNFRLPTSSEWYYAALGGCVSKGYSCSGSNNSDEVAWYANNSKDMPHPVKTKLPNEIGLYDMSGNIAEYLEQYYSSYYYWYSSYGGSYVTDNASLLTGTAHQISYKNPNSSYSISDLGLRIAISDIE